MTGAKIPGGLGGHKKRHRVGSNSRLSSTIAVIDSSDTDLTLTEASHEPPPLRQKTVSPSLFNDTSTADVILRLYIENYADDSDFISAVDSVSVEQSDVQIYLHSDIISRSKYFATLLSDRWQRESEAVARVSLRISPVTGSINDHLTVLQLLYTNDFSNTITSVSTALLLLPIALELLFEECVTACVKFLEAVPWTENEEKTIMSLIPFLKQEESEELLARVSPVENNSSEEMLYGLILAAIHNHPNMAFAKAFVAKLLRDFSSKDSARRVLDRVFLTSLKVVKESLEEYSSPDFRGDNNETEAIQRLHLHTAMKNGRNLLWLVERMIELGVAETAVEEWSDQASFTADLQRAIRDEAWRNIVPALPAVVLRCTCKLANAVATGSILAARQVRMKFVKDWLPVLTVCKDNAPIMSNYKSLYLELEEAFLQIISTLPLSDAQELLQQCLSFSTRNVDDCPHLVTAFNTWFSRANQPPPQA